MSQQEVNVFNFLFKKCGQQLKWTEPTGKNLEAGASGTRRYGYTALSTLAAICTPVAGISRSQKLYYSLLFSWKSLDVYSYIHYRLSLVRLLWKYNA